MKSNEPNSHRRDGIILGVASFVAFSLAVSNAYANPQALRGFPRTQAMPPPDADIKSYSVQVRNGISEDMKAMVVSAKGLVWGSGRAVECVSDICDRLSGWDQFVGRLRSGEFIALQREANGAWVLRASSNLDLIAVSALDRLPITDVEPKSTPDVPDYQFDYSAPIPIGPRLFLGIWTRKGGLGPKHLVSVFTDIEGQTLKMAGRRSSFCTVATSDTSIVAIGTRHPFQGAGLPITIVLRPAADRMHVTELALFTDQVQCLSVPA